MDGTCGLCENDRTLKQSHLLPSFIFKWKKKHNTGFFRTSENPNIRAQDGLNPSMLCGNCEQLFSPWEKQFAEKVFKPFHDKSIIALNYSEWLLQLAVSVSWRNLYYHKLMGGLTGLSEAQIKIVYDVLEASQSYLLDSQSNIDSFEQHIFPVGTISGGHGNADVSPFLNRYLATAVDFDLLRTDDSCLVYSKLNRLVIIGVVQHPDSRQFEGTKITHPTGKLSAHNIFLPAPLLKYFNIRADKMANQLSKMSENQWSIIEKAYEREIDKFNNCEMMKATDKDYSNSGQEAFEVMKSKENTPDGMK